MKKIIFLPISIILLILLTSWSGLSQTTYTVTNTNNTGAGSLRQAIIDANSNVDLSNINFSITGTAPFNIVITAVLPDITTRVSINGLTQTGTAGAVRLSPSVAHIYSGLTVLSGGSNSVIEGLEISNFVSAVHVNTSSSVIVRNNVINASSTTGVIGISFNTTNACSATGNKIGVNLAGTTAVGSMGNGIHLNSAMGTTISGNHIAGQMGGGINLSSSNGNTIKGNLIGPNSSGSIFASPNQLTDGIILISSASNIIGGTTATDGNIIGGTKTPGAGIFIMGESSTANSIKANKIGINSADAAIPNSFGIELTSNCSNTIIGGAGAEGNIISCNSNVGISITDGSNSNSIKGNKIGVNAAGTIGKGNSYGIAISGISALCNFNIIGGDNAAEGNIISGNANSGIDARYSNQNTIKNNLIGVDINGTGSIPNEYGILLSNSTGTTIGDNTSTGNIISKNTTMGIWLDACSSITIKGNKIGTTKNGKNALGNIGTGIHAKNCLSLTIGSTNLSETNVIAGNSGNGIEFQGTSNSFVVGNRIGVEIDGTYAIANTGNGIDIQSWNSISAASNIVNNNIISGNNNGIYLHNLANNHTIKGNYIGTNAAGTASIPNNRGIYVNMSSNTIGGSLPGEGNLISGNTQEAIYMETSSGSSSIIGNKIGVNAAANAAIPNGKGIRTNNSGTLTIGGVTSGQGNIISGNNGYGIYFQVAGTCTVKGNFIGTNSTNLNLGNAGDGITIEQVNGSCIGGLLANEPNIIAYNFQNGVSVKGTTATNGRFNPLLSNIIFANGVKAINLNMPATPGNNSKAAPVITSAIANGSNMVIAGTTSASGDRIQIFLGSGSQQAKLYLAGYDVITTGTSWIATIPYTAVSAFLPLNPDVVATATATNNNTSELSTNLTVTDCNLAVSFSALPTQYCLNATPLTLTATPTGGVFSGTNVSGTTFTPATTGSSVITYTLTVPGCSVRTAQHTINIENYSDVTVSSYCDYEPGLRRRWVINHPTHINPMTFTYDVTNPLNGDNRTGTVLTNNSGKTYFETEAVGNGFVGLFDFANAGDPIFPGYTIDDGTIMSLPAKTFGWDANNTGNSIASVVPMWDNRYNRSINTNNGTNRSWSVQVPRDGIYEVRLICGAQSNPIPAKNHNVVIAGTNVTDAVTNNDFDEIVRQVTITSAGNPNRLLTISPGASAANLFFSHVEIRELISNTISLKACNAQVANLTQTGTRCNFGGPNFICTGTNSTVYSVQTPGPTPVGSAYNWSVTPSSGANFSAYYPGSTFFNTNSQTGLVTITMTETNSNYVGGASVIRKDVYIQPVPQSNFNPFIGCVVAPNYQATFVNVTPSISPYTSSYKWYVDNTQLSTATNLVQVFNNAAGVPTAAQGAHNIKLETTVRGICSKSYTLYYVAAPTPPASFTVDNAVCSDVSVPFTNTSAINSAFTLSGSDPKKTLDGAWQFIWDFNDGSPISNENSPSHAYENLTSSSITKNPSLKVLYNNTGCSTTVSNPVSIYSKVQVVITSITNVGCPGSYGGAMSFTVSGGTLNYYYKIINTATGTVLKAGGMTAAGTVTTSASANLLGVGSYRIEVTDKGSSNPVPAETERCTTVVPFDIIFDGPSFSICTQLRGCSGGTGKVRINSSTSATSPYKANTYAYTITNKFTNQTWSGQSISINGTYTPVVNPNNFSPPYNLPDGSYTIKISTNGPCSYNFDFDMGPPVLSAGLSFDPICNIAGLTTPVVFVPSLFRGTCSPVVPSYTVEVRKASDNTLVTPTGTLTYTLAAGAYKYVIAETNSGCTINGTFDVTKGAPFTLDVTNIKNTKCNTSSDGSASALLVGGTSNVNYSWINTANPSTPLLIQGSTATGLAAGTYQVIATDNVSGCSVTSANFSISNPPPLEIQSVVVNGTCGSTATMVSGKTGTPNLRYAWELKFPGGGRNMQYVSVPVDLFSHTATNIVRGDYDVTVIDANGCVSPPFAYNQPAPPVRTYEICVVYVDEIIPEEPPLIGVDPQLITEVETETKDVAGAIEEKMQRCLSKVKNDAEVAIKNECENPANLTDQLTLDYELTQYQYTLYKYNRRGELVATLPPNAVQNMFEVGTIPTDRVTATASTFDEYKDYQTSYRYNSLGQLVFQNTPDAGNSEFYYDNKGQIRFSRNAKQLVSSGNGTYMFRKYDALGRQIEVGENNNWTAANGSLTANLNSFSTYPTSGTDRMLTYYSQAPAVSYDFGSGGPAQRYQRNRISKTERENTPLSGSAVVSRVYYSYDPHGNVEWIKNDHPDLPSYVAYEYDLLSNKVTKVKFNEGFKDRLFHKYSYDTEDRIVEAYTSTDNTIWDKDIVYDYYMHGYLRRAVLGQDKVQGLDYTYSIHGWLKGINSPDLVSSNDPGGDNGSTVATDVFGMALTYYKGDFRNCNGSAFNSFDCISCSTCTTGDFKLDPIKDLFNGNIAAWSMQATNNSLSTGFMGNRYEYDRLNRIVSSDYLFHIETGWLAQNTDDYKTTYSYDPNGNIKTLSRKGITTGSSNLMDNLSYTYDEPLHTYTASNRLKRVTENGDHPNQTTLGWGDISAARNNRDYSYDETGNLVLDLREQIKITWDIYGKVKQIDPTDASGNVIPSTASAPQIRFNYDPIGSRWSKTKTVSGVPLSSPTDYYLLDAAGNMMEVIRFQPTGMGQPTATVSEMGIYGSERIGEYKPANLQVGYAAYSASRVALSSDETVIRRTVGLKQFELKDHLGSVIASVSDRVTKISGINPLRAEAYSCNAYYPFGMSMPGKSFNSVAYRFGFNGKENDTETGFQNYGMRQYNPRLARFFSVDPIASKFPMLTPYQFAGNTPIEATDLDGLEPKHTQRVWMKNGTNIGEGGPYEENGDEKIAYDECLAQANNIPKLKALLQNPRNRGGTLTLIMDHNTGKVITGSWSGYIVRSFQFSDFQGNSTNDSKIETAVSKAGGKAAGQVSFIGYGIEIEGEVFQRGTDNGSLQGSFTMNIVKTITSNTFWGQYFSVSGNAGLNVEINTGYKPPTMTFEGCTITNETSLKFTPPILQPLVGDYNFSTSELFIGAGASPVPFTGPMFEVTNETKTPIFNRSTEEDK